MAMFLSLTCASFKFMFWAPLVVIPFCRGSEIPPSGGLAHWHLKPLKLWVMGTIAVAACWQTCSLSPLLLAHHVFHHFPGDHCPNTQWMIAFCHRCSASLSARASWRAAPISYVFSAAPNPSFIWHSKLQHLHPDPGSS